MHKHVIHKRGSHTLPNKIDKPTAFRIKIQINNHRVNKKNRSIVSIPQSPY